MNRRLSAAVWSAPTNKVPLLGLADSPPKLLPSKLWKYSAKEICGPISYRGLVICLTTEDKNISYNLGTELKKYTQPSINSLKYTIRPGDRISLCALVKR